MYGVNPASQILIIHHEDAKYVFSLQDASNQISSLNLALIHLLQLDITGDHREGSVRTCRLGGILLTLELEP